jgi:hypothetical protein
MAEEREPRQRVVADVRTVVMNVSPSAALEELRAFRDTLYTVEMHLPDYARKLVDAAREVTVVADGFAQNMLQPYTLHAQMAVSPRAIPTAFKTYMVSLLLLTLQVLDRLEGEVRGALPLSREAWNATPPGERRKLAELARWYRAIAGVVMSAVVRNSQALVNILGRSVPDVRQRSAVTVEPLGRAIMHT